MAKTVVTNTAAYTPYCTVAQFLQRFDARTVGDLVSDSGTRIAAGSLASDGNLLALLKANSGKVESACQLGGRYIPADLIALTGNQLEFLASIVANLTFADLVRRRPELEIPLPPQSKEADELLNALSMGDRIFGFQETMDAGVIDQIAEDSSEVEDRAMVTYHARRYFGRRANRIDT